MEVIEHIDQTDAAIVRELYPTLRRFAGVVAPWHMDPDDVLHGSLVKVLQTPRFDRIDDPAAYLRRAIVNHVRSELRRSKTQRAALTRLSASETHQAPTSFPSDVAELMRLRPTERAVLFLHDVERYSFSEVAEMVGISAGHARMVASRARRRLRAELLEEDGR
ncbi:MAG: sigma-70 family RNA polymerase sigma factor [bacterium]|nr:sigma-70 family RNA polymerase sigma factor [bacterium]